MKKTFFIPVFLLLAGLFSCEDDNSNSSPQMKIQISGTDGTIYEAHRIALPNDTVWREDSLKNAAGEMTYFDVVDTIYRVNVDSVFIPSHKDTLLFKISTNSTWQFDFAETKWDTICRNGVVSSTPLDWFKRPTKVTGGGNSSITVPISENEKRKRGVIFNFLSKNPLVKCQFMIVQDVKPKN